MSCDTYKGSDFTLAGQFTDGLYRTAPTTPDAIKLKFSTLSLNRNPERNADPTIRDTVLAEVSDEIDESPEGSITTIACLNEARFWFQALMGAPVTTGTGPYVHTFTLSNDCRPDFLLELKALRTGSSTPRIRRYLGGMLKDFSWDILGSDQNFSMNLLMAAQVRPFPTTVWDSTLAEIPKARALAAKGELYDISGSSTLGKISGATINVNLNPTPMKLGDGQTGYGAVLPGDIDISGTIDVLMTDGGITDFSESHTSKKIVIKTQSASGAESLVWTFPTCEFDEPSQEITTKQGIVRKYKWMARNKSGDPAVTAVLTNAVDDLATP